MLKTVKQTLVRKPFCYDEHLPTPGTDPSYNENGALDFCIKQETETFNCADMKIRALAECRKSCSSHLSVCSG